MVTLEVLKGNVVLEHIAILQYLHHMFFVKDEKLKDALEEIAKEEMFHMYMFASRAVSLGHKIKLSGVEEDIFFDPSKSLSELIKANVDAEREAIEIYTSQIDKVSDDFSKRLLEKISKDERKHKVIFEDLLSYLSEREEDKLISDKDQKAIEFANGFLKEKYKDILKYLEILFNSTAPFEKDVALNNAVDSMKAMSTFANKMIEKDIFVWIKRGIKSMMSGDIKEMEELQNLFERMRKEEEYYGSFFIKKSKTRGEFTIGDLTSEE